jgi:hypothetical protein
MHTLGCKQFVTIDVTPTLLTITMSVGKPWDNAQTLPNENIQGKRRKVRVPAWSMPSSKHDGARHAAQFTALSPP